jgi:phosphoglycolate phosphatase-like HAD superfamily hydrolase
VTYAAIDEAARVAIVFDIDGTLCDTCAVDDEVFSAVTAVQLGIPLEAVVWDECPHITDTGISAWLSARHRGRDPSPEESEAFAVAFESALRTEWGRKPDRFRAMPGAAAFLSQLTELGCIYAIATGGRDRTARLKLAAAGLPADRLLASSDDSRARTEIFSLALSRLGDSNETHRRRIVLVGDGVWDVRTAAQLGWAMVGVGSGERATRLRAAGANVVIPHFEDKVAFANAIQQATAPLPMER